MRIAKIFYYCTRRVLEFGSLMVTHWYRNLTNSFQPSWRPVYRALGSSSSCCMCLKLSSVFLLLCIALSRRLWRRPRLSGGRAAQRYCSCDCTCQGLGGKVFQDGDCLATNGRGRGIPSDNFNPRRQFAYLCHLFSVFRNGYTEAVRCSSHSLELNKLKKENSRQMHRRKYLYQILFRSVSATGSADWIFNETSVFRLLFSCFLLTSINNTKDTAIGYVRILTSFGSVQTQIVRRNYVNRRKGRKVVALKEHVQQVLHPITNKQQRKAKAVSKCRVIKDGSRKIEGSHFSREPYMVK